MPEPAAPLWQRLGTLLPEDIRERVFEPACYERLRHDLEHGDNRVPIGVYALAALIEVVGLNFPRVLFDGWRLSRVGKLLAGSIVTSAAVAWVIVLIRYSYPSG